jgi:dynein heavy chain
LTAEKILDEDYALYYSPVETYFVDFLREPPEPTGEEPEDFVFEAPKIYEEMPRYAHARARASKCRPIFYF